MGKAPGIGKSLSDKSSVIQPASKPRHRFTLMMVIALVIVFGTAAAFLEYGNVTTVHLTVAGSADAYFAVVYGSTNATLPQAQNAVVDLPPNAQITVYAYPNASYQVDGWKLTGAQEIGTGQDSISIETGSAGSNIALAVDLSNSTG